MAEILLGNIKGPKGVTFTPSVDSDGNLSWSNDGGLTNPATVNIKGPKGDQGGAGEGGGGSGDWIPKAGARGVLAGYETLTALIDFTAMEPTELIVDKNTPDSCFSFCGAIKVSALPDPGYYDSEVFEGPVETWTKAIMLFAPDSVELGEAWQWAASVTPDLGFGGILVLHANALTGVASYVPLDPQ